MRRWLVLALVFVLLSVPGPAEATDYRWSTSQETVCVDRHNSHYWGVVNAVKIWNEVSAGQPTFRLQEHCPFEGSVHIYDSYRPDWRYAGATYVTVVGGRIEGVTIRMNDAAPVRAGLGPTRTRRWKRYAMGHEFGHALGLHHSSVDGSIMCYCTSYWANNGSLHWTDRQALRRLY